MKPPPGNPGRFNAQNSQLGWRKQFSRLTPSAQLLPKLPSGRNHYRLRLDAVQQFLIFDAIALACLDVIFANQLIQPRSRPIDVDCFDPRPARMLLSPLGDIADPCGR